MRVARFRISRFSDTFDVAETSKGIRLRYGLRPHRQLRPPDHRRLPSLEGRSDEETSYILALRWIKELQKPLSLRDQFAGMIRRKVPIPLADWLADAERSPCAELKNFARGIRKDEAAVAAAMTESWSNGPVEGAVNRLKLIKCSMFGRVGFQLLRARVQHVA